MKLKKWFLSFLFILLFIFEIKAQNWHPLANGLQATIYHLLTDTTDNVIYASGTFVNYHQYGGVAKWNGLIWDSVGDANKFGGQKQGIYKFRDTLIISGLFYEWPLLSLMKLIGNNWATFPKTSGLSVNCFTEKDGILYFGGSFNKCGNDSTYSIGKYDGTTFSGMTPCYESYAPIIQCMSFFNDTLYIGGCFYLYPELPIAGLAKWNGHDLIQVNSEFVDNACTIEAMAVYKNELYVGGYFTKASGFTGDFIMKWNGHQFSEVGGGTNQRVTCMKVYNNELYVGGWFTEVGGNSCKNVAKWDGIQWTCLNYEDFDEFACIRDICIWNDELYIAGTFRKIGNDSINSIAKYNHPLVSVNNYSTADNSIRIFPNPVTNILYVESPANITTIEVYDLTGKLIFTKALNKNQIDISPLAKGLYFIKLTTEEGSVVRKFVKE